MGDERNDGRSQASPTRSENSGTGFDSDDPLEKAEHLWHSMMDLYGKTWIDQFDREPKAAWVEVVGKYSGDQIRAALYVLIQRGDQYPPTLPAFRELLGPVAGRTMHRHLPKPEGEDQRRNNAAWRRHMRDLGITDEELTAHVEKGVELLEADEDGTKRKLAGQRAIKSIRDSIGFRRY